MTAATATHCPFWQAVPAPHDGVQARGTQDPSTQTLPVLQKSAQVAEGEDEVQAASDRSSQGRGQGEDSVQDGVAFATGMLGMRSLGRSGWRALPEHVACRDGADAADVRCRKDFKTLD